jgi:hypothetical protein
MGCLSKIMLGAKKLRLSRRKVEPLNGERFALHLQPQTIRSSVRLVEEAELLAEALSSMVNRSQGDVVAAHIPLPEDRVRFLLED